MLTKADLERRRRYITSSDAAVLFGCGWYTRVQMAMDKIYGLEPDDKRVERWYWGHKMEGPVIDRFAEESDLLVEEQYVAYFPDTSGPALFSSTVDGVAWDASHDTIVACVEAKLVGIRMMHEWGEPGSDQVPPKVWFQCQHHMLCTGAPICYVLKLDANFDFGVYPIERHEKSIVEIMARGHEFWDAYVIPRKLPPRDLKLERPTPPEFHKRVRRVTGKVVEVGDLAISFYRDACESASKHKKVCDAARSDLLDSLGDAEIGVGDSLAFTYTGKKRKVLKVMKREELEIE